MEIYVPKKFQEHFLESAEKYNIQAKVIGTVEQRTEERLQLYSDNICLTY